MPVNAIKPDQQQSLIYFWDHRTVYIGQLPDIDEHRLASAALVVSLEGEFRVRNQELGLDESCTSALIPPGFSHETLYNGAPVAVISLEPESNDYAIATQLMQRKSSDCYFDLKNEDKAVSDMTNVYRAQPDAAHSSHLVNSILYVDEPDLLEPKPIDKRIRKAMEIMREDPAQSHSLESLAESVHLSATRFTHLFKDETGVPIRRYRQWLRFRQAIQQITSGETMTVAAMQAGFTDSAHFSRAFRSMFGLKPSEVFRKSNPVRTFIS
ncbi:MAG: AraC family transcriptional regulator [Gammaproteobacteria bacterium]|nr:AraC family transcriptional regulator [Gammaproteobacteria bacterium]